MRDLYGSGMPSEADAAWAAAAWAAEAAAIEAAEIKFMADDLIELLSSAPLEVQPC